MWGLLQSLLHSYENSMAPFISMLLIFRRGVYKPRGRRAGGVGRNTSKDGAGLRVSWALLAAVAARGHGSIGLGIQAASGCRDGSGEGRCKLCCATHARSVVPIRNMWSPPADDVYYVGCSARNVHTAHHSRKPTCATKH